MTFRSIIRAVVPDPILKARLGAKKALIEAQRRRFLRNTTARLEIAELLRDHTCVTRLCATTQHGSFFFDAKDTMVGWSVATDGIWEARETEALAGIVRDGDTAIDVGANVGWFTVQFAKAAGERGRVYSFEPDPANFSLLVDNIALNGMTSRTTALQLALLDRSGTVGGIL